jgi:hypothetical protein
MPGLLLKGDVRADAERLKLASYSRIPWVYSGAAAARMTEREEPA